MEILLFLLGAICGSFANWAIYQLGYYRVRSISPLGPRDPQASPRQARDRIPIIGWWFLRRDWRVHGKGFWIRPMVIEIAMAIGFVLVYRWHAQGGLIGFRAQPVGWDSEIWFATSMLLLWLLCVATFIDFDEKTIPDWITIPGTLAGLTLSATTPQFRLPEVVSSMAGISYQSIHFCSPEDISQVEWHRDWRGLAVALAIIAVWIYALVPKTIYWRRGFFFGLRIQWASMFRWRRRGEAARCHRPRTMFGVTRALIGIGVVLALATLIVGAVGTVYWESYLGSLLGLAYSGGLVWAVRGIASWAMRQEAMGFGDVTLAAMIGSFLGWQAGLLVFTAAPFAALLVAVLQFALTRNREIAFGPYLAVAALGILLGWYHVWDWARITLFGLGNWLHVMMVGCLAALGLMLRVARALRGND